MFPQEKKIYSNDDDPFADVKGLISDMIARLEEKASADATHKAFEAKHTNFDETYYPEGVCSLQ